jgi:hypothetical protein
VREADVIIVILSCDSFDGQVIEEVDGLYENEGASVPEGEALCAAIASLESQQAEAGSERRGPLAHLLSLLYEKQVSASQYTTPPRLFPSLGS